MSDLPKRDLGKSGLSLTTIGLGTWAIGGGDWKFGWGHQDEAEAIEAICRACSLGVNWVDTAAVYGDGRSEELVGQALRQIDSSERPLIATKCGRQVRPDGTVGGCIKRETILQECDGSLSRLGVEAIDLYQVHWPIPDEDIEEAWSTLVELKEVGKVRHIGVSNHSVEQMARLEAIHHVESLQPPYSLLVRGVEEEILPYCGRNATGVIVYSPMYKGMLTGAFSKERAATLSESDHRSRDPQFQEPLLTQNLKLVEELRGVARQCACSVGELAVAWVLRRPEVTSAIVGARRPSQIESLLGAGSIDVPELPFLSDLPNLG